jgi:hypothetical protein
VMAKFSSPSRDPRSVEDLTRRQANRESSDQADQSKFVRGIRDPRERQRSRANRSPRLSL